MELYLYSTSACHLCERAKEILWPLMEDYPLRLQEIDIADTDELLERYGVRIPVLKFADSERELGWPFDSAQLRDFLAQNTSA
jgi:glutaredoxin